MWDFLRRYVRERRRITFVFIGCVLIFAAVFAFYRLPFAAVAYPAVLCLVLIIAASAADVYRAYKKRISLTSCAQLTSESVGDELLEYENMSDGDYRAIIDGLCAEVRRVTAELLASERDTLEYFTMWVHQIKTPLASMRLRLESEDSELSRQLMSDLLHIEQYVEMVLTYLRLGSEDTDYVFCETGLDAVIREAVRERRGDFILRRDRLIYEGTEVTVMTDAKWLSFVIGQVLSNALKYTADGIITITASESGISIRDTGIGIAPEDMPRIFERGYTGRNGRTDKTASGLGLYLCRQICDRLGHTIEARVVSGGGAEVIIGFGCGAAHLTKM